MPHNPHFPLGGFLPAPPAGRTIHEPARDVPVVAECDVAVFGGGPAGVCAATAAARAGKSVLLVERHGFLGGVATAGGVTLWHSLYGMDGRTKVIGGLADEIIRRLRHRDGVYNGSPDGETGHWVLCPHQTKFVLDDLVLGSGVKLLLHTWLAGTVRDGRRVAAALVEGKSGRGAVVANVYIDCTGDADLVRRAGCKTQLGDGLGHCQPPGLVFRLAGRKDGALSPGEIQAELSRAPMDYNGGPYPAFLWGTEGVADRREQMFAGVRVLNVDLSDSLDFTRAEVEGRYQLRWFLDRLKHLRGWEEARLLEVAPQIGPRESHRILAEHQLTRQEVLHGVAFSDAIAQGKYPIDIHTADSPGILFEHLDGRAIHVAGDATHREWRWDGQPAGAPPRDTLCYRIPYRCLVPRELDNVLAAGRCAGANHESAGAIRVMVNCMQLGEAAGVAAAIVAAGGNVRSVPPETLRQHLIAAGAPLLPA